MPKLFYAFLYAMPAWGGFLTADLIIKNDAYLDYVNPFDSVIVVILNCCMNFFMVRI